MKGLISVVLLATLFCFTSACQNNSKLAEKGNATKKDIETAADNLATAISGLNPEEVTGLFSNVDGTKYISDGAFIPRDGLKDAFREFYGTLKEMHFAFEKKEIQVLSHDVAVLTSWAHYTAITREGQNIDERAIFTSVYLRVDGKWSIFQAHKSLIKKP